MDRAACAADACPCPQLFLNSRHVVTPGLRARIELFDPFEWSVASIVPAPLQRFEGFQVSLFRKNKKRHRNQEELRTRTGISRARGTVHESILYSREMLSRGT